MSVYPEGSLCPNCNMRGLLRVWNEATLDEDVYCRFCDWRETEETSERNSNEVSYIISWRDHKPACLLLLLALAAAGVGSFWLLLEVLT